MRLISCRKHFHDANEFSTHLALKHSGGDVGASAVGAIKSADPSEIVFVHGYNSRHDGVVDAYRSNCEILRESGFDPARRVTGFLWPGLGERATEAIRFRKAIRHADAAARFLAAYLAPIPRPRAPESMSRFVGRVPGRTLIGHSLGCRVILEAVCSFGAEADTIVLMGAAVDADALTKPPYAEGLKARRPKVMVFWSADDGTLCKLYRLDQFDRALGCSGVDASEGEMPTEIQSIDVTRLVPDHNRYRHSHELWRMVHDGER